MNKGSNSFVLRMTGWKTGVNIKKKREQKGLSQSQLADLIHMQRLNYSKVENGFLLMR